MLHIMLDAYKCTDSKLNDMRSVYDTVVKVTDVMGVVAVMSPVVVPYYFGVEPPDDGISAFILLKGGHFTIHTFPQRECYFVDILYDGFLNEDKFTKLFERELPFEPQPYETSRINKIDRRFSIEEQRKNIYIDIEKDFGPHYLIRNVEEVTLDIEKIYTFLDDLPSSINMTPITRPQVITDSVKAPNFISGITMIAQSHIALHYNIASKNLFADIFSCSFIDYDDITSCIEDRLSVKCENVLISRGSKHAIRLPRRDEIIEKYNKWRKNI